MPILVNPMHVCGLLWGTNDVLSQGIINYIHVKKQGVAILLSALFLLFLTAPAMATVQSSTYTVQSVETTEEADPSETTPVKLNFQVMIGTNDGGYVNGERDVLIGLYKKKIETNPNSAPLWSEEQTVVFSSGVVNFALGETKSLDYDLFQRKNLRLGMTIGDELILIPLSSVAYSIQSKFSEEAHKLSNASFFKIKRKKERIGIGKQPEYPLDVNGSIRADFFRGDGRYLSNLPASSVTSGNLSIAEGYQIQDLDNDDYFIDPSATSNLSVLNVTTLNSAGDMLVNGAFQLNQASNDKTAGINIKAADSTNSGDGTGLIHMNSNDSLLIKNKGASQINYMTIRTGSGGIGFVLDGNRIVDISEEDGLELEEGYHLTDADHDDYYIDPSSSSSLYELNVADAINGTSLSLDLSGSNPSDGLALLSPNSAATSNLYVDSNDHLLLRHTGATGHFNQIKIRDDEDGISLSANGTEVIRVNDDLGLRLGSGYAITDNDDMNYYFDPSSDSKIHELTAEVLNIEGPKAPGHHTVEILRQGGDDGGYVGWNTLALTNTQGNFLKKRSIGSKVLFKGRYNDGTGAPDNPEGMFSIGTDYNAHTQDNTIDKHNFFIKDETFADETDDDSYRFLIDTDGNVGIGTVDPQSLLDIDGDLTVDNITMLLKNPGSGSSSSETELDLQAVINALLIRIEILESEVDALQGN